MLEAAARLAGVINDGIELSAVRVGLHDEIFQGLIAARAAVAGLERTEKRLRRGVFTSVPELVTAIDEYIVHHNIEPKPFIWTERDILQKVIRAKRPLKFQTECITTPGRNFGDIYESRVRAPVTMPLSLQ